MQSIRRFSGQLFPHVSDFVGPELLWCFILFGNYLKLWLVPHIGPLLFTHLIWTRDAVGRWTLWVVRFYNAEAPPLLHPGRNLIIPFTRLLYFEFPIQLALFCEAGVESISCADAVQSHDLPPANTVEVPPTDLQLYILGNLVAAKVATKTIKMCTEDSFHHTCGCTVVHRHPCSYKNLHWTPQQMTRLVSHMGGNHRTHSNTCFDILTPAEPIEKPGICPVCQIVLGVQRGLRNAEGDVNGTKWSEERKWFSGRTWIEVIEPPAEIEEVLQVDGRADRRLSRRWWDDPIEVAMKATRRDECQGRADPIDFAMHATRRVERAQRSSEIEELEHLVKKKSWTDGVTWNPRQSLDTLRNNLIHWVEERRERGVVDKRDKSPDAFRKSKESSRKSVARKSMKSWVSGKTRISVLSRSQSRARTARSEPAEKVGGVEEVRSAGASGSPAEGEGIVDRREVKVKMKWWRKISESWSRRKSRAGLDG